MYLGTYMIDRPSLMTTLWSLPVSFHNSIHVLSPVFLFVIFPGHVIIDHLPTLSLTTLDLTTRQHVRQVYPDPGRMRLVLHSFLAFCGTTRIC
jgi:hypothetical protein